MEAGAMVRFHILIACMIGFGSLAWADSHATEEAAVSDLGELKVDLDAAAKIYKKSCRACHGRDAQGAASYPGLADLEPDYIKDMNTTSLQHEIILEGLDNPWDMAFLDDGTMLFTEKCKGLSVRMSDGAVNALYGVGETEGYNSNGADLFCEGQAGMMGVAFDPDFSNNRRIYVYSTSNMSDPHTNRLMRFTLNEDFTAVSDRTAVWRAGRA